MDLKIEPIKWINKTRKTYISLGFVFLMVGIVGLSIPFLSMGFVSDTAFLSEVAKEGGISQTTIGPNLPLGTPAPMPSIDPNRPNIKNRLVIAKGGINLALVESKSVNALWKGGWVFPTNSTPDRGGNTVIFGHRFKYLPPISNTLYNLDKVEIGDKFYIDWGGQRYNYQVSERKIIDPTDLSVLNPTKDAQVTIITCFPLFSTKQRLVVVGQLIKN